MGALLATPESLAALEAVRVDALAKLALIGTTGTAELDAIVTEGAARLAAITSAGTTQAAAVTAAGAASIATMGGLVTQAQTSAASAANSAAQAAFSGYAGTHATKAALTAASGKPNGYHLVLADESNAGAPWVYLVASGSVSGTGFGTFVAGTGGSLPLAGPVTRAAPGTGSVTRTLARFDPRYTDNGPFVVQVTSGNPDAGDASRGNEVMKWGHNINTEAPGKAGTHFAIEAHYAPDARNWGEAHLETRTDAGVSYRLFSFEFDQDRTDGSGGKIARGRIEADEFRVVIPTQLDDPTATRLAVTPAGVYLGGPAATLAQGSAGLVYTVGEGDARRLIGYASGETVVGTDTNPVRIPGVLNVGAPDGSVSARVEVRRSSSAVAEEAIRLRQFGSENFVGVAIYGEHGQGSGVGSTAPGTRLSLAVDSWTVDRRGMFVFDTYNPAAETPTWQRNVAFRSTGDIELFQPGTGHVMVSPDGTRYRVTMANGGTLTITSSLPSALGALPAP